MKDLLLTIWEMPSWEFVLLVVVFTPIGWWVASFFEGMTAELRRQRIETIVREKNLASLRGHDEGSTK